MPAKYPFMHRNTFLFIGIFLLASCLNEKEYDLNEIALTPTVALPLASGEISILDLVSQQDSTYLKVYSDGLLYFSYRKTFASSDVHDLFLLQPNTSLHAFDLPPGALPPNTSTIALGTLNRQIDLNLSPEQLSEILLKGGTLTYSISLSQPTNPNTLPLDIVFTLTDVVDKTTLAPLTFTASVGTGTKSLQNYVLRMISNRFNIKLDFSVRPHSTSILIPPNDKANVQLTFDGMDFSYLKGFLGDQTANLPAQTIPITIFSSSLNNSNISIVQPTVTLSFDDYYGVPGEVTFSKLQGEKAGAILPLQITPPSPVNLSVPSVMGSSATTSLTVTNASAIMNFSPTDLVYAASVRINKGLSSGSNFLTDAPLNVTMSTEVPLYGRASGIKMIDTLEVDLGKVDESNVSNASLHINATNELPLDANIQIYLADKDYHVMDSIFAPNQTYIVKASSVTAAGELQTAGASELQLGMDPSKITKLFSTQYLIVKVTMNTTKDSNGVLLNVKFKASYKLKLHVGLLAKLNIKIG